MYIYKLPCCQQVMKLQMQSIKTRDNLHNLSIGSILVFKFSGRYYMTKLDRKN